MDWEKATSELTEGEMLDFLKLDAGKHTILFKDDGKEKEVEYEGKKYDKVFFKVEHNGEEFTWSVSKGVTKRGLFGQIAAVGKSKGKLDGEQITLIVNGNGKNRTYTVLEAAELNNEEPKQKSA
jgi:hypothetical protein